MALTILGRVMGLFGLLLLALFVLLQWQLPELPGLMYIGSASAVGMAAWVYLDWDALSRFAASQGGRDQAVSWLLVGVVVAIAGLVLHLAEQDPVRWDWTEDGRHSLDPQTVSILESVPADTAVSVVGWFASLGDGGAEAQRERFSNLLDAAQATDTKVNFELIDPNNQPLRAQSEGIDTNATVIVSATREGTTRTEQLFDPDEQELANAIVRLGQNQTATIYTVVGHGERSPTTPGDEGLSRFTARMQGLGFEVKELNTTREATIPEDAALLVMAGPLAPLSEPERERLVAWVEAGGSLWLSLEPPLPGQPAPVSGLEDALRSWGLQVHEDLVVDPLAQAMGGDPIAPLVADFPYHEVTKNLRLPVLTATARSLGTDNPEPEQRTVFALARTSEAAWGETNLQEGAMPEADADDGQPPLTLFALSELHMGGDGEGKVFVSGDVDWMSDLLFDAYGNRDFAVRAAGFLARRADVLQLQASEPNPVLLEMSFAAQLLMSLWAVLVTPGLLLGAGALVWVWRRSL